ncbi:hypothetical protein LZ30DRAFT_177643 [Colletotrichum cereale]|nr:hypothetical protein LZ30DRAFT_177643 [Colletotrichum cereale]
MASWIAVNDCEAQSVWTPPSTAKSFVMRRPPSFLPCPTDPRAICDSMPPSSPSSYVRPQFLGCRRARSRHHSRGKPDRPHFPIRMGYTPMRPTMDPGPDDSAWWSGWNRAGSVSRGSRQRFPEWLILDDVHHSSPSLMQSRSTIWIKCCYYRAGRAWRTTRTLRRHAVAKKTLLAQGPRVDAASSIWQSWM